MALELLRPIHPPAGIDWYLSGLDLLRLNLHMVYKLGLFLMVPGKASHIRSFDGPEIIIQARIF